MPSRASRAPRSSSCQSIVRRREPRSCGRCSMARRSWPADAKSASKKLSPSTTTGLETAVKAMGANGSDPRKMRHCGSVVAFPGFFCIDAFALFRWQAAFVDATTAPGHPQHGEQRFARCAASTGGCASWERCRCALSIQSSSVSRRATCKGGVLLGRPRTLFGPVFLRASQYGGQ